MNPQNLRLLALVLAGAALCPVSSRAAANIGASFLGRSATSTIYRDEAAGVVSQSNWNNIDTGDPVLSGASIPLVDSAGNFTAVQLIYQGNDSWNSDGPVVTPNDRLMKGIYKANPNPDLAPTNNTEVVTLTMTNLPAGTYDVIVYTTENGTGAEVAVTQGGTTYYIVEQAVFDGTFLQASSTTAGVYTDANYARFNGVAAAADGTITVSAKKNIVDPQVNDGIGIAGIQLVQVSGGAYPVNTVAPQITSPIQPAEALKVAGETATFSIGVDGPPWNVQWQKNGVDIPGATRPVYTTPALSTADTGAKYKAIVSNNVGSVTSGEATLTVDASAPAVYSPGFVKVDYYDNIGGGTAVTDLLNDPTYIAKTPTSTTYLGSFDAPSHGDNYGAEVTGWIIPEVTGLYNFFIRSDDASQLYLSSNDTIPDPRSGTLIPICEETGCCNGFYEPGADASTSEAIQLTAGQKYGICALVKEGGGGDYVQVAWRISTDTTPAASLQPIPGKYLATTASPAGRRVSITTGPQSQQVVAGLPVTLTSSFEVLPTDSPRTIQWLKNGQPVSGANGTNYTTPELLLADSGVKYSVKVTVPGDLSATSSEATVTVVADTVAPTIRSVIPSSTATVLVTFSEKLDKTTAETVANYSLTPAVSITGAALGDTETTVLLSVGGLNNGAKYTLTVNGVKDRFNNTMNNAQFQFTAIVVTYADVILADKPVMFYTFEETTGQVTTNLGTAGAAADGLWKTGPGPDDSVPANVSFGEGPRPNQFLGFAPDNRSGKFTGSSANGGGDLWVDAQKQLLNNLGAFSLEYWVKPKNRVAEPDVFGTRIGIVGQNDAIEYGFINQTTIQIWTPGGGSLDTTYSFPDETWHHVATIGTGSSIVEYFDGVFQNQVLSSTANYGSSTYNVHVGGGGAFDATGNFFTGEIDAVAIFDRAIPADRILAHYNAGKNGGGGAATAEPSITSITLNAQGQIVITWDGAGTLQSTPTIPAADAQWTDVAGSSSGTPVDAPATGNAYYRVKQ